MSLGNHFILAGAVYGVIGMLMGFFMAGNQDLSMTPVHSHILLLGWVSMALFGLVYRSIPAMAAERLAKWHFMIMNTGFIAMMVTLSMAIKGNQSVLLVLVLAEIAVILGMVIFAWLMLKHRKAA